MKLKMFKVLKKRRTGTACFLLATLSSIYAFSQDGNAGLNEANTRVRSYFDADEPDVCYRCYRRPCRGSESL